MSITTTITGRSKKGADGAWSIPATRRRVLGLMDGVDWQNAKVCDVGAGPGLFSQVLCDFVRNEHGLEPKEHVFACDLDPSSFGCDEIECVTSDLSGRLPFEDDTFDVAVMIEVIEHVEDQFAFFRELKRITKPGGRVIVSTPNTINMNSRMRGLFVGFPLLFGLLPLNAYDARFLGGHIHPISPYFLAYTAIRAGFTDCELRSDRTKRSSALLAILFFPLLALGSYFYRRFLRRKQPAILSDNDSLLKQISGWELLTGRTAVLRAFKR